MGGIINNVIVYGLLVLNIYGIFFVCVHNSIYEANKKFIDNACAQSRIHICCFTVLIIIASAVAYKIGTFLLRSGTYERVAYILYTFFVFLSSTLVCVIYTIIKESKKQL